MANTKISALVDGSPAQSADIIPIDRAGTNFSVTAGSIAALAPAGTVTSIGETVNGSSSSGIFTISGSPVTGSGTINLATAGTSGGIPYFSSGTVLSTSTALTANSPVLGGGAGTAPSTKTFLTTDGAATLTVGIAGGGNGVLALSGNTSGSVTFTAPAIAGTITNAVISSNSFQVPSGTSLLPSLQVGAAATGVWSRAAGVLSVSATSAANFCEFNGFGNGFLVFSSGASFSWTSGLVSAGSDTALSRLAAGVVSFDTTAVNNHLGFFQWGGQKRVSTQFDSVGTTTLATVTGLSVNVAAGRTYTFKAVLQATLAAAGGGKFAIAGTATATSIVYQVNAINNSTGLFVANSKQVALGGAVTIAATPTDVWVEIVGTITVNAAGTLLVQGAQATASGTSSVLVGSVFTVYDCA